MARGTETGTEAHRADPYTRPVDPFGPITDAAIARASLRVRPTRLEAALAWAGSLAPSPLRWATGCCGASLTEGGPGLFEALGSAPPAVSARSADLLIIAGSLTHRQIPLLEATYARMLTPRWVIAWGECAISGGPYSNYATLSGVSRILPVDVVVRGCPPSPAQFRAALEALRAKAEGQTPPASSGTAGWPIQGPWEVDRVGTEGERERCR